MTSFGAAGPWGVPEPRRREDVNSEACFDLRKKSLAAVRTERSSGHVSRSHCLPAATGLGALVSSLLQRDEAFPGVSCFGGDAFSSPPIPLGIRRQLESHLPLAFFSLTFADAFSSRFLRQAPPSLLQAAGAEVVKKGKS